MNRVALEPVIGVEVHAELATQTKMFCGCVNNPFDREPNHTVCPTCLGLPGALPAINRAAVMLGIRAALALNCEVADVCLFERKNYAYPDLVKGYQISQYELPIGRNGSITIVGEDEQEKQIPIRPVHLEEDTAKLVHTRLPDGREISTIDCNRSGVPLLEIVTEPEIFSVFDADQYLRQLQRVLLHNGISHCRMQRGEMRLEANISLRPVGSDQLGNRVEVKNQSSFRFVRDAIAYEVERQTAVIHEGKTVRQATHGWDPDLGRTFEQRSKEDAQDYRYFPEPDLPPVRIEPAWVEEQRRLMPRPIEVFQSQLVESGIPPSDAKTIVANGGTPFLLAAYESYPAGVKEIAKCVVREVFGLANAKNTDLAESKLTPSLLIDVVKMVDEGKINREGARKVIEALFEQGGEAEEIARRKSLYQIRDGSVITEALDAVLQERGDLLDQYRSGKTKVRDAIFGMVMKRLKGRGDPKEVGKALAQVLEEPK